MLAMFKKLVEIFSAMCGAVAAYFAGLPPLIWILIAVMALDYITGLMCGFHGTSPKTESGKLSSSAAFKGLMKKAVIILVVFLAALLDQAVAMGAGVEFSAVTGATCLWFIASEGLSIVENAAALGVKIPKVLQKALEIMQDKDEPEEEKDHGTD